MAGLSLERRVRLAPVSTGTHSSEKMLFNCGSPAETFGGAIDPDAEYLCCSQRGPGRCSRGSGLADCNPIRQDTLGGELSWVGSPGWPAVGESRRAGCPGLSLGEFYVKMRFHIAPGTKLYSLTLDPPEVAVWRAAVPGRID